MPTTAKSSTTKSTTAERVRALHDRLTAEVEALVSDEDWARFLTAAARFHTYSANNVWLILAQRPDATRVAGYRAWQRLGRQVNKRAKGIAILAPCVYRRRPVDDADPAENPAILRALLGITVVHVFDESDTTGDPVADMSPVLLEGDGALWDGLAAQVASAGYRVSRGECGRANGRTDFAARAVVVASHLSGRQADKTLCHELAHVCLHDASRVTTDRDLAEIEAESVAFIVCNALGIDTASYTLPYVARWAGGDVEAVRRTAERVVTTAQAVLAAMAPSDHQAGRGDA
jgi:hypothetical protein